MLKRHLLIILLLSCYNSSIYSQNIVHAEQSTYIDQEGLLKTNQDGLYGFIDKKGQVIIPLQYDFAWSFDDGLAIVLQEDKRGFIDSQGKIVIPFQYKEARYFDRNDTAFVIDTNGDSYRINKNGDCVSRMGCPDDKED